MKKPSPLSVWFLALLLASLASLASRQAMATAAAAADDDGQVDAATEDLVQQGIAARRAGKDDAALATFLQAEERAPSSVRILLHIATAAQGTGKWLMAHAYLQKASAYRAHPYYQKYRSAIRQVEDSVAQHVGQFRAQGTPSGAEVMLNGEVVGTLPMDRGVAVEIGAYELEVTKTGFFPLRRPINVAGGGGLSTEAVELKSMDYYPSDPVSLNGAGGAARTRGTPSLDGEAPARRPAWVTWTLAGGSVLLLGTSAASFVIRERDATKWNNDSVCLDRSRPDVTRESLCGNLRRDVTTAERVGVVTGAIGVALGAAAIAHWLIPPHREEGTDAHHASRDASCVASFSGVACSTTF